MTHKRMTCDMCGVELESFDKTIDGVQVCKDCFRKEWLRVMDDSFENDIVGSGWRPREVKQGSKSMQRLCEMSREQIDEWRDSRQSAGCKKYADKHLQRYGAVDIMEELLDAENILNLLYDRVRRAEISPAYLEVVLLNIIKFGTNLTKIQDELLNLDECLDDNVCTDEQGGNRIWWGE